MVYLLILILMGMMSPAFAQSSNSILQSTAVPIPGGKEGLVLMIYLMRQDCIRF